MVRVARWSCLVWGAAVATVVAAEPQLYPDVFFEPSRVIATPHVAWAVPYAGKPPRVLFLTHRKAMREVVEIAQRLSLDYRVFATWKPNEFGEAGISNEVPQRLIHAYRVEELTDRLRAVLANEYDVIVAGNVKWDTLPIDCRYEILKKVKAGTGLVGVLTGHDEWLERLVADSAFVWGWNVWSGKVGDDPDFFGKGEFDGGVDADRPHSGELCLRVTGKSVRKGTKSAPYAGFYPPEVKLAPNTEYVFSMWTRTAGLKDADARVSLLPVGGGVNVPASDEWQLTERRFKTDATQLTTRAYLLNWQVGTVWYDDVKLCRAGDETNLLPNPGFENPGRQAEELLDGVPWKAIKAFANKATAQDFLRGNVLSARFRQGRLLLLKLGVPTEQMLTPAPSAEPHTCRLEYEHALLLAMRLILAGAGREPEVIIASPAGPLVTGDRQALAAQPLKLNLRAKREVGPVELELVVRGERDRAWPAVTRKLSLKAGDNAIELPLPLLPAGSYYAGLRVLAAGKVAGFGAVGVEATSATRFEQVALDAASIPSAAPLTGTAALAEPRAGAVLRLTARDGHGRTVATKEVPAGHAEVTFRLPLPPLLAVSGVLEAALVAGPEVLDRRLLDYTFRDLYSDRAEPVVVLWQNYPASFIGPLIAREFAREGVDAIYGNTPGRAPQVDQRWIPYATRFIDRKTDWYPHPGLTREPGDLVRLPCLTDPKYRDEVRATLTKYAETGAAVSTMDYTLGDENHLCAGRWDLCFSDTCVADFRVWAKQVYGSLDKLNAEWGSAYKAWDEVMPARLEEAKKTGNFVPWIDHRLHMDSVWAGIHDFSRAVIQKVVPGARVGYEGSDVYPGTFQATDYWKLSRAMDLNCLYYRDFVCAAWHDFAPAGMHFGGGWFGGYPSEHSDEFNRWFTWRTLFKGANAFWVFLGYADEYGVMAPDLSCMPYFRGAYEEMRAIKSGPGRLLMASERQHDGVAVLWSASSLHLATCTPGFPELGPVYEGLMQILHDTGVEGRVVSYEQLAQGQVTGAEFKAILLPGSQALSPAEAARLKRFVADGGTLVADLRPGFADEHGKPYATRPLDEVFGVSQAAFSRVEGALSLPAGGGLPAVELAGLIADGGLKPAGGRALGKIGEAPAVVVNAYGQGRAVLLNFSLGAYGTWKVKSETDFADWPLGQPYRDLLGAVLQQAGVKPAVSLTPALPHVEVSRFRHGGAEYLGVVQSLPREALKYVTGEAPAPAATPVTIRLAGRANLYDVRAGQRLGQVTELKTSLTPGRAQLFAALPYEVQGVTVETPKKVAPGGRLTVKLGVRASGKVGTHVLRVQLHAPGGGAPGWYGRNLTAPGGQAAVTFPLALDEPAGTWKVNVRDVASGVTASGQFVVGP